MRFPRTYWIGFCVVLIAALCVGQSDSVSQSSTMPSVSANEPRIIPPPPGFKFPDGETFVFSVEWKFLNAGSAQVGLESVGGEQKITAIGNSAGMVNSVYKVRDNFESTFDPRTFCSLRLSKHTEEGSRQKESEVRFDYEHRKSILEEKNLKTNEVKHAENDIPGCVSDLLSGFYYLGSLSLQPGSTHLFEINDGGKTTVVSAKTEGHENIKVPAGSFDAVKVRAEALSGAMKGKGSVIVWFADGPEHVPVQMKSKLGWGTLLFRLQQIEKSGPPAPERAKATSPK